PKSLSGAKIATVDGEPPSYDQSHATGFSGPHAVRLQLPAALRSAHSGDGVRKLRRVVHKRHGGSGTRHHPGRRSRSPAWTPVSGVVDVTGRTNLAGAGLNLAQRVMNCGDAGHILVSKHVAEDLEEYDEWRPLLHELGECEVKHGVRISVSNLYTEELGNPAIPEKLKAARAAAAAKRKRTAFRWVSVGVLALLAGIAAIGFLFFRYAPRFAARALGVPEKSIAVLPFQNLS